MDKVTYVWKADYALGIEDIDFQHHFFFNLIVRLAEELVQSKDQMYKNALVDELIAYARFHFISEENIMSRANYPELSDHKNQHLELIDKLSSKTSKLDLSNSAQDSAGLIDFLMDWFFHHTTSVDKIFAQYVHGKEEGRACR